MALAFSLIADVDQAAADKPVHLESHGASAELIFDGSLPTAFVSADCDDELPPGEPICRASVFMQQSPSGFTIGQASIDAGQLAIESRLLRLDARMDGLICDYLLLPVCVPVSLGVSVRWASTNRR